MGLVEPSIDEAVSRDMPTHGNCSDKGCEGRGSRQLGSTAGEKSRGVGGFAIFDKRVPVCTTTIHRPIRPSLAVPRYGLHPSRPRLRYAPGLRVTRSECK